MVKLRDEQEKRKEVTCKLQATLTQLDVVLSENSARSSQLHDDNVEMSQKLAHLYDQISKRSEETRSVEKQLELQKQLFNTELSKNNLEFEAEKEVYRRQIELLQYQLQEKETEIKISKNELSGMELKVDEYIKKYADIEPFISQSSKLFETYKGKIESINASKTALETEMFDWQKKYNDCMRLVVDLTFAVKLKEKEVGVLERKLERLQKLCRQLQTDRSTFIKQLKGAGIEPGLVQEVEVFDKFAPSTSAQVNVPLENNEVKEIDIKTCDSQETVHGKALRGEAFHGVTFRDGSSLEGSSCDGSSYDGTSFDGSSRDGTYRDETSLDGSSRNGSSRDGSSVVRPVFVKRSRDEPSTSYSCDIYESDPLSDISPATSAQNLGQPAVFWPKVPPSYGELSMEQINLDLLKIYGDKGPSEVGAGEVDAKEVGAKDVGTKDVGTEEVDTKQVGARKVGFTEDGANKEADANGQANDPKIFNPQGLVGIEIVTTEANVP